MQYNLLDRESVSRCHEKDRTLIVERVEIIYNDKECLLFNFKDITALKKLDEEKETSRMLKVLNASVHHEMIGPLKTSVDICKRLIPQWPNKQEKRMLQTVLISC